MKLGKAFGLAALLLAVTTSSSAWAHGRGYHHHHHGHGRSGIGVGIVIGAGLAAATYAAPRYYYGPRYYAPPVYYYPAPVVTVAPPAPPVYIEQQQAPLASAPSQPSGYWYFCSNPAGYYPSVQECPQGWQKVLPRPSSTQ